MIRRNGQLQVVMGKQYVLVIVHYKALIFPDLLGVLLRRCCPETCTNTIGIHNQSKPKHKRDCYSHASHVRGIGGSGKHSDGSTR